MRDETTTAIIGDEVIQMAIQMEETGRDFYETIGSTSIDPRVMELCRTLAEAETNHCRIFRRIRSDLARQGKTILLQDEKLAESRLVIKNAILPDQETMRRIVTKGRVSDLFDMAMQMEKDAIRFYRGIASKIPERDAIEAVIREEQDHLRILSEARNDTRANR